MDPRGPLGPIVFEDFLQDAGAVIFEAMRVARSRGQRDAAQPGIIKFAFNLLKQSRSGAILTDKDGGFALVDKEALFQAKCNIFSPPFYERVGMRYHFCYDRMLEYVDIVKEHTEPGSQLQKALLHDTLFKKT